MTAHTHGRDVRQHQWCSGEEEEEKEDGGAGAH